MAVLVVAAAALTQVMTSAFFTDTATITDNTFTSGTVDVSVIPATSAITLAGMAPGDTVTTPIFVSNTGTLGMMYAVDSVTTEDLFAAQLELTIKTNVTSCTSAEFGTDGTTVYATGDLGSTAGTKIIGDSAQGPQAGDRALVAGGREDLCAQVVLPPTTDNTFQNKSTTATLAFNAEQTTSVSYSYQADAPQSFTVPAGVTSLSILASGSISVGNRKGGLSSGNLAVTPGQVVGIQLTYDVDERSVSTFIYAPGPALIMHIGGGDDDWLQPGWSNTYAPLTSPFRQVGVNGGVAKVAITYTTL